MTTRATIKVPTPRQHRPRPYILLGVFVGTGLHCYRSGVAFFAGYTGDNLLHGRISDCHIQDVTMLHDGSDNWPLGATRSINLQL